MTPNVSALLQDSAAAITHIQDGFPVVEVTPEQRRKWEDTLSMMTWTAPGFLHLMYRLLNAQENAGNKYVAVMSPAAGVACTDGRNIAVNPETFLDQYSLPERVFILGHEVVHNVYGDVELLHRCATTGKVPMHDGTSLPFDMHTMQISMDARINALLVASNIGRMPKDAVFDKTIGSDMGVLDIYQRFYKPPPKLPPGGQPGKPGNQPGKQPGQPQQPVSDDVKKPGEITGKNPQAAAEERNGQQWAVEIAAAQTLEQVRTQGKMAAALERMFKQVLEPEVPWVDHIKTLINRLVGDGGIDWFAPDPNYAAFDFFSPAPTGHGAGWIVVWGDTSGSRADIELASNIAELGGIMEAVNPERLTLIWCDADIEKGGVIELQDASDLTGLKPMGGGGTSYEPVRRWIKENGKERLPDLFIGFTDGYVSFPKKAHPYPTIWASSTDVKYPFGQVVRVLKRAKT